ncbi:MAG: MmpS family transport accessory protein [Nocardioides sp.]|uniref:MmpS family transport accessory protein n=1 Tax=Nocardioides sp. TaxID=35761 RepID=UPI0039E39E3D
MDEPESSGGSGGGLVTTRQAWTIALAACAVFGLAAWLSSAFGENSHPDDDLPTAPTEHVVVYEVEGTPAYADITISTPTGTQQASPDVPLRTKSGERGITIHTSTTSWSPYISAQNPNEFGRVTCRITLDGTVISENTSTGSYGIAVCHS